MRGFDFSPTNSNMIFARIRNLCPLLVALLAQAAWAQGATLTIQGEDYKSTCVASEWETLKGQVVNAASGTRAEDLAALVHTALCGKGSQADETVRHASIGSMKLSSTSTGDDGATVARAPRARLKALAGAAWNAFAEASDAGVDVHFYKNEACVQTLTFKDHNKSWHLVAMAEACD